ncbi:hypothetical protein P5673_024781 [Acropora cervicornis]|uniref:Uncharacterized protein n=1 Tax=Acropora cervicornis TaxID=6130 RepID=A0AAD9Q2X7_ACRCE|nr:hypothetical protein P5673_024781 [Acropora cervicornis]
MPCRVDAPWEVKIKLNLVTKAKIQADTTVTSGPNTNKQSLNSPRIDWVKWNPSSSQHNLQVKNSWMLAITLHLGFKIPLQETLVAIEFGLV